MTFWPDPSVKKYSASCLFYQSAKLKALQTIAYQRLVTVTTALLLSSGANHNVIKDPFSYSREGISRLATKISVLS